MRPPSPPPSSAPWPSGSPPAPIPLPSHGSVTYCARGRGPDDDLVLAETLHGAHHFAASVAAEYRETLFQLTRCATDRPKTLAILQRHIDHLPAPARICPRTAQHRLLHSP
ncbi:hypothetical protein [Streptomyces albidoflavus]|uniref:hypothetical protein n=1 Tax=Streptomyces albidoflavus TaxID=1886 RepID=UPI001F5DDE49|nr:hypothetical protein [Streptomyces albidoflavus]